MITSDLELKVRQEEVDKLRERVLELIKDTPEVKRSLEGFLKAHDEVVEYKVRRSKMPVFKVLTKMGYVLINIKQIVCFKYYPEDVLLIVNLTEGTTWTFHECDGAHTIYELLLTHIREMEKGE